MSESISRRGFVKGAVAATAATAATAAVGVGLAGCASDAGQQAAPQNWDKETDVVVLGFGGAGAVAAATAFEEGAEVIILEKAPKEGGGTTRISTGSSSIVLDPEAAKEYFHHQVKGLTPDEVFEKYIQEGMTIPQWLDDHDIPYQDISMMFGADYKNWPGSDAFGAVSFAAEEGEPAGAPLFNWATQFMADNGIEIVFDAEAYKLVQDPATKEIIGVLAKHSDGSEISVGARRGVVLCTGGFECNDKMIGNYLVPAPLAREGWIYNTGDGLKMAMEVGAEMWHMNLVDSYGVTFTAPGDISGRFGFNGASCETGSFMWINRNGKRFMCENPSNIGNPYGHRGTNMFALFDDIPGSLPQGYDSSYRDVPFYVLFDQKQFDAAPLYNDPPMAGLTYLDAELGGQEYWSADNKAELEKGWILTGQTIEEIVAKINENSKDEGYMMDAAALQETIDTYNADCAAGTDSQFGRPATQYEMPNLTALDTPPYYAMRLMPCMNTTKGGPVKNGDGQVLDLNGEVIPRLYVAGTLGHSAAQVYCIFGANIAECINFGRISGRNAANESPRA